MKKIGFLEKWNETAGVKEFSMTRLQMILFTLFTTFFIWQFYIVEANEVSINSIVLILVMFSASFFPKAIKDFQDIKNKL